MIFCDDNNIDDDAIRIVFNDDDDVASRIITQ